MGKINLLDDRVINQIAAGEVVENPASVIKELVENSIDAGSTSVTIEFSKGGTEYIRIIDNGSGMDESDASAAFIRHATSKISSSDDLQHIATMGFRGEALASISEVSQVELTTSTGDIGTKIIMRAGICESVRQVGFTRGTTIEVSNLFFNTPARRKFLKSLRQETNNILELCSKFMLAHPEISFKVVNNGRLEMRSDARGSVIDAICGVYGPDAKAELIEVSGTFGEINISGYVCKPAFAQLNRKRQSFFVNGRYVKSAIIAAALDEAYKGSLMGNKFPYAVLYISLPYDEVDVNVHPQKTEVRFENSKAVFNAVMSAAAEAISPEDVFPEIKFEDKETEKHTVNVVAPDIEIKISDKFDEPAPAKPELTEKITDTSAESEHIDTKNDDIKLDHDIKIESKKIPDNSDSAKADAKETKEPVVKSNDTYSSKAVSKSDENKSSEPNTRFSLRESAFAFDYNIPKQPPKQIEVEYKPENEVKPEEMINFNVCGILWDTYIIVQNDDNCYIIDQHAAHERFLYDKYSEEFKAKRVAVQQLLIPEVIDAEPSVIDIISENTEMFAQLGFDIEIFGSNSCIVRGVPSVVCSAPAKTIFNEAVELIKQNKSAANLVNDIVCEELMKSACKHAVKGNQKLSDSEIRFILNAVRSLKGLTCPHGRPIAVTMSRKEMEKRFGRIQ